MAGYNKVIFVLTLILVCWLSGVFSVCRKRCRQNNPQPCGDNKYICKNDSSEPPVERCYLKENQADDNVPCGSSKMNEQARDCLDVRRLCNKTESGVYNITLWESGYTIEVYCDQVTDGGGWTVFQYRFDGSVDFYRTFAECENGFGSLTGEFWLGLKYIEEMASLNQTELRIDLSAADGSTFYETFKNFSLVKEDSYELHFDESSSDAAEVKDLTFNNGHQFTTFDHDVDLYLGGNCAVLDKGSWWYNDCTYTNLNGKYITPGTVHPDRVFRGMIYYPFKQTTSLKTSKMMFRRN